MEQKQYWSGKFITSLKDDEIFVFGSNPEGRHGAGAAKAAMSWGAKYGMGRGLQGKTYALITKNLTAGYTEAQTGITYDKEGFRSVSPEMITANIEELYNCARKNPDRKFLITYQYETWPNGTPKKSLNGYTSQEILELFAKDIPQNIVFHDSYKPHLEKLLAQSKTKDNIKENAPSATISESSTSHAETSTGANEIAFTKVSLPYGWLGNMARYAVEYKSVVYPTTEALFQALRFENHPDIQQEIIAQKSPMAAKMTAKKYTHLLEAEGYEMMGNKDVENMRLCIDLKVAQHPHLAQELLNTGDAVIIEDCSNRPQGSGLFWGAQKTPEGWVGENILGQVWMDKRAQLQNIHDIKEDKEVQYTYFFNLASPFSNFHPARFTYRDYTFSSSEQFMMFSKAKTFGDDAVAQKIMEVNELPLVKAFLTGQTSREQIISDPTLSRQWNEIQKTVKGYGKAVKNYNEQVWCDKRVKVVGVAVREKFSQNDDLKQILINTGETIMVEASPYDKIWGIGLSEANARKTPPEQWPGDNLLGYLLTDLKEHFRNGLKNGSKMKM